MVALVCLIVIAGVVGAVWRFVRATEQSPWPRTGEALAPLCAAALAIMFLMRLLQVAPGDWNEAKLAPVVAITRGYSLYQNPDTGVMTGWIYGPIGAIVLLPAALGKDPTTVSIIGCVINALFLLAPAAWILARASRGRAKAVAALAFMAFAWEATYAEDLLRCTFIASSDGPALGLAACACAAIYLRRTPLNMAISALAAVLCFWTKQNYLLVGAGLVAYVAIVEGVAAAGTYLGFLAGFGAVVSGILCYFFNPADMWFHMVAMPRSHPFRNAEAGAWAVWVGGISDLALACSVNLGLLFFVMVLDSLIRPRSAAASWFRRLREWFTARPWSLLLLVALFSPPGSLAGYMKIGGFVNSLASTNYFLCLAALAAAVELDPLVSDRVRIVGCEIFKTGLLSFNIALGLLAVPGAKTGLRSGWAQLTHPYTNAQQEAFAYAKAHPNEIYCPWNPLTTLLADGRLYHFEWGVEDRVHANRRPGEAQFFSHLPKSMNKFVYCRVPEGAYVQSVFGRPPEQITVPEMPHCLVYKF